MSEIALPVDASVQAHTGSDWHSSIAARSEVAAGAHVAGRHALLGSAVAREQRPPAGRLHPASHAPSVSFWVHSLTT